MNGEFEFILVKPGGYLLRVSYTGYVMHEQRISVRSTDVHVGTLQMPQSVTTLSSVLIEGDVIPVEQKGDTVQYNANAFKTNPDATAGDLLAKMPGMMVDGNEIQAQGENVTQILVDGKRFFADDPQLALTNLRRSSQYPSERFERSDGYTALSFQ